jgi:integrase
MRGQGVELTGGSTERECNQRAGHEQQPDELHGAHELPGALTDRRMRDEFLTWRDKLAVSSRRQADYAWAVLARIIAWAHDRGLALANPCVRGGRLYRGTRADKIWSSADEAAFLSIAPKHLHLPLLLALWTGQRQGDLLRLPWSAYDGTHIRLRQSKSIGKNRRMVSIQVRVGAPLKAALDATRPGARLARRPISKMSRSTTCAAVPSHGLR